MRSGPFYVQVGGEVISLVAEAEIMPLKYDISHKTRFAEVLRPVAVYVIDKKGVRRMAVGSGKPISLPALLLGIVLMPLQYVLFEWRRKSRT